MEEKLTVQQRVDEMGREEERLEVLETLVEDKEVERKFAEIKVKQLEASLIALKAEFEGIQLKRKARERKFAGKQDHRARGYSKYA